MRIFSNEVVHHRIVDRRVYLTYRLENISGKGPISDTSLCWAGIMINGRTRLHVVENGTMKYDTLMFLLPHVHLFRDLNPIENVWDALGRQVAGRNYPPTNKNTLIRAFTEEWDKFPLFQLLDNFNMVRRMECCITLHGGQLLIPFFKMPADF
ncbi:hypothetical protein TNCV_1812401 [Trichonephila clavipes]|uniref:Transposable element Tc3 transposase n=1 Tax=Trichonephila clavipes TaxID=2585209 RepID=A0A8X6W7E9_TRICX|nr:hypothetical protein TNCV_1812401 [Trichonephila clavipes]